MKNLFRGYKEVFTVKHGRVHFRISYNPKPKSDTDFYLLDIKPFEGDRIKLLLCDADIHAMLILFGLAMKHHQFLTLSHEEPNN
jgi:hypothetical protein